MVASDPDSPVDPKKRKGESPAAGKRSKKQRLEEPEPGEVITEAVTHEEPREEVPETSSEGEDAEVAALKDKAAREERKATKERRSKAPHDTLAEEAIKEAGAPASGSAAVGEDASRQAAPTPGIILGLTQSPVAEVVNADSTKSPPGPSGLGQFPLPSSGFDELQRQQQQQLRAMHQVIFHSPSSMYIL